MDGTKLVQGKPYKVTGTTHIRGFVQDRENIDIFVEIPVDKLTLTYVGRSEASYYRFGVTGPRVLGQRIDVRPYYLKHIHPA